MTAVVHFMISVMAFWHLLLCIRNTTAPSVFLYLRLHKSFYNRKEIPTVYANRGPTLSLTAVKRTCVIPRIVSILQKIGTTLLRVISLSHSASCHNSNLRQRTPVFWAVSFSLLKLILGNLKLQF